MADNLEQELPESMEEFLSDNEAKRATLLSRLDQLTPEQMTGPTDAVGWTVKDHIVHLTIWERGIVFALQSKPRHEGMRVPEELYLDHEGFDAINDFIFQANRDRSLEDVLDEFDTVHQEMLTLLGEMSWEELERGYSSYLPHEPGEKNDPIWYWIYSDGGGHYSEHLPWINAIVEEAS